MGFIKKNKSTLEEKGNNFICKGNNLIQKAATLKGNESQAAAPALISVAALHEHQSLQSQWKTRMKKKHRSAFVPIKDNNYTPVMDRGPSEVLRGQGFIVLIALGKAMSG